MTENFKEPVEIKITQDKLVDLLLHAATREDIAKLDSKIDAIKTKLDNKIDALEAKLDNKIDTVEARLSTQLRWVLGTTLGVGVSIIGVMIGLASFMTHYIQH